MDTHLTNISVFAEIMGIDAKTLQNWYMNHLSDFKPEGQLRIHKHDIEISTGQRPIIISVPICEPQNIDANMCIDEKMIGEDYYTILTNKDSGKIAFCARTTRSAYLSEAMIPLSPYMHKVKTITRDMAGCYEKLCTEMMPDAVQIADKFHVISNLMDAVQAVRVRYRQKQLEQRRNAFHEFKCSEKKRRAECEQNNQKFKPKKFVYKEERLENGETYNELLHKSHFLLYKFPTQWTNWQENRATLLFKTFPEIQKVYSLACDFRNWYAKGNIGKHPLLIEKDLYDWYEEVEDADIDEISNFKALVQSNEDVVTAYFINGHTNAYAENLNKRIKKFIGSNNGIRNLDFFFFRLSNHFA